MINVIGLCGSIRDMFPIPAPGSDIKKAILIYLGYEPPQDIQLDLVKVLVAHWKRKGWTWDDAGAVLLEDDEEALFHDSGVSLIKSAGDHAPNNVLILPVKYGEYHARVVWF